MSDFRLSEFEAMPAKRDERGRENCDSGLGKNGRDARDGLSKVLASCGFVDGMDEASCEVAGVAEVNWDKGILALIEFIELPLGGGGVKMGHALASQSCGTFRHNEYEAFDYALFEPRDAAGVEPKDSAGQGCVDGGLGFLVVDSDDG